MIDALIPLKAHSERVPNKNFRELAGKPLYIYILETLSRSKFIENIYIDTDAKEKFELSDYPEVKIIDRPEELRGDMVSVNALIEYDLNILKGDIILQTHATNPMLKTETVDQCITKFLNEEPGSLFSVTPMYERFWRNGKPVNHDPNKLIRTQDLEPLYMDNSCIYIFTREFFNKYKRRMNDKSKMFVIDKKEAFDIDTKLDWRIVECLMKKS